MPVFRRLLERWGFVKLGRYGLVRTPDDRIVSTRPVALDDGAGGRIVGWRDNDLAMAELAPWQPEHGHVHAPAQPHVQFAARPPVIAPARVVPPLPPARPAIPQPSGPAQVRGPALPGAVLPAAVAPETAVDEDDWEWTIALARARAAAEELPTPPEEVQTEVAAPAMEATKVGPAPRLRKTRQMPAASAPSTPAAVSSSVPAAAPSMPVAPPSTPAIATASTARLARSTVIPVPLLPSIFDAGRAARFEPVVRTTVQTVPPAAPNRFAKGTAPIASDTEQTAVVMTDDTDQSFAIGDRTTPGIGMPLAARAVALPSIKRNQRRG
jgi:hypothetical protein